VPGASTTGGRFVFRGVILLAALGWDVLDTVLCMYVCICVYCIGVFTSRTGNFTRDVDTTGGRDGFGTFEMCDADIGCSESYGGDGVCMDPLYVRQCREPSVSAQEHFSSFLP